MKSIVERVRNELLQWTTELEKHGVEGEEMNFNEREKPSASSISFSNCTIQGNAGNVTDSQVNISDDHRAIQYFASLPKTDRRELEDIIDDLKTAPPDKKLSLLERGEKLIVKHKELLGAGAEILTKVVKAASGQPGHH